MRGEHLRWRIRSDDLRVNYHRQCLRSTSVVPRFVVTTTLYLVTFRNFSIHYPRLLLGWFIRSLKHKYLKDDNAEDDDDDDNDDDLRFVMTMMMIIIGMMPWKWRVWTWTILINRFPPNLYTFYIIDLTSCIQTRESAPVAGKPYSKVMASWRTIFDFSDLTRRNRYDYGKISEDVR